MIIEFFKRGTGGSDGPIDYFLGKNRDRDFSKLLSGNLEEIAELIDSSAYVKKYTAGCLSFLEDDLTDSKKKNLMLAFERTLFPGLTPEQYRIAWIEHRDKEYIEIDELTGQEKKQRRLELNFLIPNVEITTGKRLQPFFAKADLNRIDDFKSIVNFKYDLFDPDDPINRRSVKIAKNLPKDKRSFIAALNVEVALAISEGIVTDRESLKKWMTTIGLEITRITKKKISVKNPNNPDGMPIPLDGEIYEQNFRYSDQSAELKRAASEEYRRKAESRYAECLGRYKKLCESKADYHLKRYGKGNRAYSSELKRQLGIQETEYNDEYRTNGERSKQGRQGVSGELAYSTSEHERRLTEIERIEPSNSRASETKKNPFFFEYSLSFDSTYIAYYQYQFRLRQQKQIQRSQSNGSQSSLSQTKWGKLESSDMWRLQNSEIMRTGRPYSPSLREQLCSGKGDQLSELRSPIIENYRRSAEAIEATTESTRRSFETYPSTIVHYRRVESVHQIFKREAQRISQDSAEISANDARTIKSNYLSKYVSDITGQLTKAAADTFERFSLQFGDRSTSKSSNKDHITEFNQERDREGNRTISRAIQRENGLSAALSRKIRSFDTDSLFQALEELDRRKQLEKNNDRGFDSPSPF